MATNYMNTLGQYYPAAQATCTGSPLVYANITWGTPAITQAELDGVDLTDHKVLKITNFALTAKAEIEDGFESSALLFPHWYDSEMEDQINLIGAVATQSTMPYSCRASAQGSQRINLGGAKIGTDATGFLNDATTYDAEIEIDGVSTFISIIGSDAQTIDTLITQIQADIDLGTNPATIVLDAGDLTITSAAYSDTSAINIIDTSLFNAVTGYVALLTAVAGFAASAVTNKEYKIHTNADLLIVINDGKDVKLTVLQKFNVKQAQVLAATTEAEIDAITW